MTAIVPETSSASEGNGSASDFQPRERMERVGKPVAIACLNAAIESFIVARRLSRAQLAEDICGMSEANFSKIANGVQGDFWALVYKLPGDIRADFFQRLHESERVDPVELAYEHVITAMFHCLRVMGATPLPQRANAMVKAVHREHKKRTA